MTIPVRANSSAYVTKSASSLARAWLCSAALNSADNSILTPPDGLTSVDDDALSTADTGMKNITFNNTDPNVIEKCHYNNRF